MNFRMGDGEYYQDREVEHTAQGDIYADVPFAFVGFDDAPADRARGGRKRPSLPTDAQLLAPVPRMAVVCPYTCGFVAQPPGQRGYAHRIRQVAPFLRVDDLESKHGLSVNEVGKLRQAGRLSGLMWIPAPPGVHGDCAIGLWAMTTVTQDVLDSCTRVARLSLPAQRRLIVSLIEVFAPGSRDPDDLALDDPDMSDSWVPHS